MKHIALLVTASPTMGAYAPFLLPAVRFLAVSCCQETREAAPEDVPAALDALHEGEALLMLDAAMPLVSGADARLLMAAVEAGAPAAVARGTSRGFPRCATKGSAGKQAVEIPLSRRALLTVNSAKDLAFALRTLRREKNDALMESGVLLIDPRQTYIDPDVSVGPGTVIHPDCTLTGGTTIGAGCTLLPNSRIHASRVGDHTTVESSVLTEAVVGSKTTVGPFAYLRPGARVGDNCRVGDFVEIKNSAIGDGTKVSHLTYVGDSDLGKRINLGCGVVFVNYDGKKKHRTRIGDDAFIGCNVNLVSPVHVGEGAYVAAGTTVTEDVPGGALAIGRAKQAVKEGWVAKRKEEGKL